jgi:hypothetical protein
MTPDIKSLTVKSVQYNEFVACTDKRTTYKKDEVREESVRLKSFSDMKFLCEGKTKVQLLNYFIVHSSPHCYIWVFTVDGHA